MQFVEQLRVPVSLAQAWEFLWRTNHVAACLPGCVDVEELEPGKSYKARFEDHVGPYKVGFVLDVTVEESVPQERIRLRASGTDSRLGISQIVVLDAHLHSELPGQTILDVNADVQVLGKVATLGQFVVKRKAREIVKQFAHNIDAELRREMEPAHA